MAQYKRKILVVDDEPLMAKFLYEALLKRNYQIKLAENGNTALTRLRNESFDLVITDIHMPDMDGMKILKTVKDNYKHIGVIVITAYGTIQNAVEAMRCGAYDYLTKPFSIEELELVIKKYFDYKKLLDENYYLRSELQRVHTFDNIIGKSEKMQKVFETVEAVAESKATVLIHGASGTGKELIARAIHQTSPRCNGSFIKTNCAALPESLAESELFGHEKGAFTGAIKERKGRFESADCGTLLLDEISEMSFGLQAKLLRVIQEKEFEKVGSPESVHVDVRIIATTNKDLKEQVAKGNFREDLYYRLNVVPIYLPQLKERKEDIPLLTEYFLLKYNRDNKKNIQGISDEVMDMFMNYDWPGNVRELENSIERAAVTSKEPILHPKHFQFLLTESESSTPIITTVPSSVANLKECEKQLIQKVLRECDGNKTKAAKKLGISVRTLRNKLKKYQEKRV